VSGIGSAIRALRPSTKIYAAEVATAAPLAPSLAAGKPVSVEYTPTFVDGIGSRNVLADMWPIVQSIVDGSIGMPLDEGSAAPRLLRERARVRAGGAGGRQPGRRPPRPRRRRGGGKGGWGRPGRKQGGGKVGWLLDGGAPGLEG